MRKTVFWFVILFLILASTTPVSADNSPRIYHTRPEGNVKKALEMANFTFVEHIEQADVLILNGTIPDAQSMASRLKAGAGLLMIPGQDVRTEDFEELTGIPVTFQEESRSASLAGLEFIDDPHLNGIVWNSAPQVWERFQVLTFLSSVQPLVTGYEDNQWLLWRNAEGNIKVCI